MVSTLQDRDNPNVCFLLSKQKCCHAAANSQSSSSAADYNYYALFFHALAVAGLVDDDLYELIMWQRLDPASDLAKWRNACDVVTFPYKSTARPLSGRVFCRLIMGMAAQRQLHSHCVIMKYMFCHVRCTYILLSLLLLLCLPLAEWDSSIHC